MDVPAKLKTQLVILENASRDYDAGKQDAVGIMATSLRTLFHSSSASRSLLAQLGKWHINLLSTCGRNPPQRPFKYWPGLVNWVLQPQEMVNVCEPKRELAKRTSRFVQVAYWWESEAVYQFDHVKVHRRDLVLHAANRDGEAHAEESFPASYQVLLDGIGWRATVRPENAPEKEVVVHNGHRASLRQIVYEVLNSPELGKIAGQ